MHPKLVEKPVPLSSPKHQLEKGDANYNLADEETGIDRPQNKVENRSSKAAKNVAGDSADKVVSQTQKGSRRCILM